MNYSGDSQDGEHTFGKVDVFIKLPLPRPAFAHQTPDKPRYEGGSWHVEGMENEAIAASGIYYYDEENITESRLSFRTGVLQPEPYGQSDSRGCELTWGIGRFVISRILKLDLTL
jgi:hypothetical protein